MASVDVRTFVPRGFRDLRYVVLGSDGFPVLANGEDVGMTQLVGVKTGRIGIPEPEQVTSTGDDGPLAVFAFDSNELPSGTLDVGVHNLDAEAEFSGGVRDDLIGGSITVLGALGQTRANVLAVLTRIAISKDTATSGLGAFQQYALPRSQIFPLGSDQWAERAESPTRYSMIVNSTTKQPHGKPLTLVDNGATEGPILNIGATNRLEYHFFQGDGLEDKVTLPFTPSSDTDFEVYNYLTGATIAATLVAATKVLTFGAAPVEGIKAGIAYRRAS